jgi:hypothetical protein
MGAADDHGPLAVVPECIEQRHRVLLLRDG